MSHVNLTFEYPSLDIGILWPELFDVPLVEGEVVAGPARCAILHSGGVFPLVRTAHLKVIIKVIQSLCFYKPT